MKHLKISNSKWAVKHLPALAAAVAVTLALAFTPRTVDEGFAQDPDTEEWVNLSEYTRGIDYECNPGPACVYADSSETSTILIQGSFAWID